MNRRSGKQAFVWIIALCLVFSTAGVASAANATDIKGHWAQATITNWMDQSFAIGYEDGTFRPEVKVNRQEFTALVNRSFGFVEPGIIQYPDGTFKPKQEMNRQEVAVIIAKLLGFNSSDSAELYADVKSIPAWSKGAVGAIMDKTIMMGYPDGTFRPLQSATRAEAITILDKALKIKAEQENVVPSPSSTPLPISTASALTAEPGIPLTYAPGVPSLPSVAPTQPTLNNANVPVVSVGPAPVNLGTAGNYVILAKTGISSVPSSVVTGNIGVSPIDSTAITGFSLTVDGTNEFSVSNQIIGKVYASNYTSPTSANLTTAISNMETAYTDAAGRAIHYSELYVGDLSGQTLTAGVYKWGTQVLINSDVTLHGGPNDVWIFQIAKGITQASGTKIILTGGAQAKNIFWQTAETVSIGTNAHFEGNILSQTNIALGTNASVNGRLLAQTAVTLDKSVVTAP